MRPVLTIRQAGFALLIVLWSTGLLALLAMQITASGREELKLAANIRLAAITEAAADAGVFTGVFHVLDPAGRWDADDRPHPDRLGRFLLTIRVDDENGKINPNLAPADLLAALMSAEGADAVTARTVAAAIVDWREPGNAPQKLQRYRAAGLPFGPSGQPFGNVADLAQVIGMTPALLARLAPHLSVYANAGLNYAHADPGTCNPWLRTTNGGLPPPPDATAPPTVATIIATAVGTGRSRFTRRATVSFGQDPTGRLFRVLAWRSGED